MTIIGLTGYAGSGKDEAARGLIATGYERKAFADPLRECVLTLNPIVGPSAGDDSCCVHLRTLIEGDDYTCGIGWDRAKREYGEVRRLLQVFGTEVVRNHFGEYAWVDMAFNGLDLTGDYVFTDCRFPNEVEAVQARGGLVVKISRPGVSPVNAHVSDDIGNLAVDYTLDNDGTIEQLHAKLRGIARSHVAVNLNRLGVQPGKQA